MTAPHHLVTVWNPSYAQDAMDEHLAVLIDWAGRAQAEEPLPIWRFRDDSAGFQDVGIGEILGKDRVGPVYRRRGFRRGGHGVGGDAGADKDAQHPQADQEGRSLSIHRTNHTLPPHPAPEGHPAILGAVHYRSMFYSINAFLSIIHKLVLSPTL